MIDTYICVLNTNDYEYIHIELFYAYGCDAPGLEDILQILMEQIITLEIGLVMVQLLEIFTPTINII